MESFLRPCKIIMAKLLLNVTIVCKNRKVERFTQPTILRDT